jgi:hypothetical protein
MDTGRLVAKGRRTMMWGGGNLNINNNLKIHCVCGYCKKL